MQASYDPENKLSYYLQDDCKNVLALTPFKFKLLQQGDNETADADELVDSVFSDAEIQEYKPGNALGNNQSLCVAVLKNGVVNACLVGDINEDDYSITVRIIAVDPAFQNKKLGSLLLLILNDICLKLDIRTVSLISSEHGKLLYKSFGFSEMAHDSFEATVPFAAARKKLSDISSFYSEKKTAVKAKKNDAVTPTLFSEAKKITTKKKKIITRKKPLIF